MHKAKTRNKAKTKSTRLVELVASFPGARSVCVAGTFNDWHPLVTEMINVGGDRWAKALTLAPGRYEYRFLVDGEWRDDPTATEQSSVLSARVTPSSTFGPKPNQVL